MAGMGLVGLLAGSGRSLYKLLSNRRKFDRRPVSGTVRLTCRTATLVSSYECSLVDVSPHGIGIECREAIAPDAVVQLQSEEGGVTRFARVCYCEQRTSKFRVGLALTAEPEASGYKRLQ